MKANEEERKKGRALGSAEVGGKFRIPKCALLKHPQGPGPAQLEARPSVLPLNPKKETVLVQATI